MGIPCTIPFYPPSPTLCNHFSSESRLAHSAKTRYSILHEGTVTTLNQRALHHARREGHIYSLNASGGQKRRKAAVGGAFFLPFPLGRLALLRKLSTKKVFHRVHHSLEGYFRVEWRLRYSHEWCICMKGACRHIKCLSRRPQLNPEGAGPPFYGRTVVSTYQLVFKRSDIMSPLPWNVLIFTPCGEGGRLRRGPEEHDCFAWGLFSLELWVSVIEGMK